MYVIVRLSKRIKLYYTKSELEYKLWTSQLITNASMLVHQL